MCVRRWLLLFFCVVSTSWACEGPLLVSPAPILPTNQIWKVDEALEAKLGPGARYRIRKMMERIARISPRVLGHLFYWPSSEGILPDLSMEIFWENSKTTSLSIEAGADPADLKFSTLFLGEDPERHQRKLAYHVFLDHFFTRPSTEGAWVELEANIAGELLGRIRRFIKDALLSTEEIHRRFALPETRSEVNLETGRAQAAYLVEAMRSTDFGARSPGEREFMRLFSARVQADVERLEVAQAATKLPTVVPFEVGFDFETPEIEERLLPHLAGKVHGILARIARHAPRDRINLFSWPRSDRSPLESRRYSLIFTHSTHPRWKAIAQSLPNFGTGNGFIFSTPNLAGRRESTILQLIFLDTLMVPPLTHEMRSLVLEGHLAFELLGRSSLQLMARTPEPGSGYKSMNELQNAEGDLMGYLAEKAYLEQRLAQGDLGQVDRSLHMQLLNSSEAAVGFADARVQGLRRRQ
jgi:hypothetical protein